jgi:hypothetical protein
MIQTGGAGLRIWTSGALLATALATVIGALPAGAAKAKPVPTTYTSILKSTTGQTVVSAHPQGFIMTYPSKTKGGLVAVTYWQTQSNDTVISEMQRAATSKQRFGRLVIEAQTGKSCLKWTYRPVTVQSAKKRHIVKSPVVEVTYTYRKLASRTC